MDDDWHDDGPTSPSAPRRRNLYCGGCGGRDFQGDDDGFFYCTECGSQCQDAVSTATAAEDLLATGGLYNVRYTRALSQSHTNPNPNSKQLDLSQAFGIRDEHKEGPAAVKFEDDDISEPRDFGSHSACSDAGKLADVIRLRYVEGLQVMLQRQCEVLVEKFGASPYIAGIVGPIWLRYVAATRVLADDWPDNVIEESEEAAAEAAYLAQLGEEAMPKRVKRIRSRYKSEPHNSYGQRAIYIWLRSLRKNLPLYSTLAISFLVCHIAREPILPTDIFKWASEGNLPYLTAFLDMDRCIGKALNACPLSSKVLFRPNHVIGPAQVEATAASIAQTTGLRLPSVNFYAIAHRYLKELCLPVKKILPHACRIYEWSLPAELWLSSGVSGFPTRACVMAVLIVVIRLLYNMYGQGIWEMSHSGVKDPHADDKRAHHNSASADLNSAKKYEYANSHTQTDCNATGLKQSDNSSSIQAFDYNCQELLSILEATYDKINTAHDYLKDLFCYLKHCKDVVYAGITKSYEEEKLIERLWDLYEKQEDNNATEEEGVEPRNGVSINDSGDHQHGKEDRNNQGRATTHKKDISTEGRPKEPPVSFDGPAAVMNLTIERIMIEMEENGFGYLPPRSRQKIGYAQYQRHTIDGKLVYVVPADYYILLRACAKLVQIDLQMMHRCVLRLEKRLGWIDQQIDKLFCHQDTAA